MADDTDAAPAVTIGNTRLVAGKLRCKAKAHGVFNSPHDSRMIYVDPDREEKDIHSPLLTEAEARVAFERGLIEDPADAAKADDEDATGGATGENEDPNMIGKVAAERTEQFAAEDDKGGQGSGTLDSRSSTAWADRGRVEGGAEGFTDGVRTAEGGDPRPAPEVDAESGDDDAPPATGRRRRS